MKIFLFFIFSAFLSGCASIESTPLSKETDLQGLMYYMPKKDVVFTVTVASEKITATSIELSAAYPDTSVPYMLSHSKNWIGKNVSEIEIVQGILTSTKSTVTSGIGDVLKGISALSGSIGVLNNDNSATCTDGTYKKIIDLTKTKSEKLCGLLITLEPHYSAPIKLKTQTLDLSIPGIFYRQNRPYLAKVYTTSEIQVSSALLFSPSESPTYFLPIAKTLFANNNAEFSFSDGVVTKYKQDTDGELIGLLKLPADVIAAYFTAAGGLFDAFKAKDTKEADAANQSLKLELTKKKYDACILAIKANDQTQITALNCSS